MTVFWMIVIALVALVLLLARRSDRRSSPFRRPVRPPEDDDAVGRAKVARYTRDVQGLGPGQGP